MSDGLFLAYVDCGRQPHRKTAAAQQQQQQQPPPPRARDDYPVGICHAHVSDGQVWIEGIRVHPGHRRRGIASTLVGSAERLALDKLGYEQRRGGRGGEEQGRAVASRMLVDVTNDPSIAMTRLLGYRATRTWTYYSLKPQRRPDASLANDGSGSSSGGGGGGCSVVWDAGAVAAHLDTSVHSHYVDSWKWFETDEKVLRDLASGSLVAVTFAAGPRTRGGASAVIPTVSMATVSGSAERPGGRELYAALYPGSDPAHVAAMVAHLADVAARGGCRSASVFSQDDSLPACDGLARRLAFHLVEKMIPYS